MIFGTLHRLQCRFLLNRSVSVYWYILIKFITQSATKNHANDSDTVNMWTVKLISGVGFLGHSVLLFLTVCNHWQQIKAILFRTSSFQFGSVGTMWTIQSAVMAETYQLCLKYIEYFTSGLAGYYANYSVDFRRRIDVISSEWGEDLQWPVVTTIVMHDNQKRERVELPPTKLSQYLYRVM